MLAGFSGRFCMSALNYQFRNPLRLQRSVRCIMASFGALDKVTEVLQKNPYYSKYHQKISEIQKESPDEVISRWEQYQSKKSVGKQSTSSTDTKQLPKPREDAVCTSSDKSSSQRGLDDILKVDLIKDKTKEEIEEIWSCHFHSKDGVAGILPCDIYVNIKKKCRMHPVFIFPLPRQEGYEFFMCQSTSSQSNNEFHFTSLINYQKYKENAPECFTMVYYAELMQEKGIVLMRGEFNKDFLDAKEALCLANQIQLYYGENNDKRDKLLWRFTNTPDDFYHVDLIAELECLSL